MDLKNIQTFIRAAELGSFTKVANELNYVQSAITIQIQQLEKELGYPLFDRIGKRISLTAMGEKFLDYAYEITRNMREAANLGKDLTEMSGTLRVGILESLLFGNILELLPKFKETYKNLDIKLKMGQASELLELLKHNQLDMVYLSSNFNADPDLKCCYKRCEQLVFLSGPNHPAAGKKKIPFKKLMEYDFIVTEHTGICYTRLLQLAEQHDTTLRASIEVDSTVAISSLIKNNTALAFLPEYSVKNQLDSNELVKLDVCIENQTYYSQILCHKSRWITPFMASLIEEIKKAYPES